MGFIRGAKTDSRYAVKQATELASLPNISILSEQVDLQKISVPALQGWLDQRIQELLGGVEDEILAGMIGNVLAEEQAKLAKIKGAKRTGWSPKELQQILGPFLTDEVAAGFMEELWVLLLDAQESPDGIPQAWGPTERNNFIPTSTNSKNKYDEPKSKGPTNEKVYLGASRSTRLRSPERVITRMIEDERYRRPEHEERNQIRHQRRDREERRYYERNSGDDEYDEGLKRRRRLPSPRSLTPPRLRRRRSRHSSEDTFDSSSSSDDDHDAEAIQHRSRTRQDVRRETAEIEDEEARQSKKKRKKHHHHHHKKRKHRKHKERSDDDQDGPDAGSGMDELEAALRQKALDSMRI